MEPGLLSALPPPICFRARPSKRNTAQHPHRRDHWADCCFDQRPPAISSDSGGRFVSFFSSAFLDPRFSSRGYFLIDRQANPLFTIPTPGSGDVGFLRFYNSGSTSGTVVGTLYDRRGPRWALPGPCFPPPSRRRQSWCSAARMSPPRSASLPGPVAPGWRQFVPAGRRIACAEPHSLHGADQHELRFGPLCAEHPGGRQHRPGLCRLYNTGTTSGAVRGTLYDPTGVVLGSANSVLVPALGAKGVSVLTAADIQLSTGAAPWSGRAWLDAAPTSAAASRS